jgi:hypothetical protein
MGSVGSGYLANTVPLCRSNIFWATDSSVTAINYKQTSVFQVDYITPSGITNNCYSGIASGTNTVGGASTSVPGLSNCYLSVAPAAQVSANPNFVDSTRNLLNYGRDVLGLTGTNDTVRDGVIAAIAADPTLTKLGLLPWVRAGFAPTNVALNGTAHDGGDIGAVAYQSLTTSTTRRGLTPGARGGR